MSLNGATISGAALAHGFAATDANSSEIHSRAHGVVCSQSRPAYLQLSSLRDDFPSVPIAAFTATATSEVKKSIADILRLKQPVMLQGSFNRGNIQYKVRCKDVIADGSPNAVLQVSCSQPKVVVKPSMLCC